MQGKMSISFGYVRASCILLTTLSLLAWVYAEEKYDDRYDYIAVDTILANKRQRDHYLECFLKEKTCDNPAAQFWKDHVAEAIVTNCKKCTVKQRENIDKISNWYATNEPENYRKIMTVIIQRTGNKGIPN